MKNIVTLKNLGLAYRKAKVDLFYSQGAPLKVIAEYEANLVKNLERLKAELLSNDHSWFSSDDFLGSWTVMPAGFVERNREEPDDLIFSSSDRQWNAQSSRSHDAYFRIMADCSVDFHVLSALWIMHVGHHFDQKLSENSYGNRLRRIKEEEDINQFSLGIFKHYFRPFQQWRDGGLNVMRSALKEGKSVIAITADVSSFYHKIHPGFLLEETFLFDVLKISLSEEEKCLHRFFIDLLVRWARKTPLQKGLPVGLSASSVIANMALIEFDRIIECEVVPLYYGRYVDDVVLVMENTCNFTTKQSVWEWVFARATLYNDGNEPAPILGWGEGDHSDEVVFSPTYLVAEEAKSEIRFSNNKNKVFLLEGESGLAYVDIISREIEERASEWRAMPRLPSVADDIKSDLLNILQDNGEKADGLRKANRLTASRAGFAFLIRDFEAYAHNIESEGWSDYRSKFFQAYIEHVLVPPKFFDFARYFPRVLRLAVMCGDIDMWQKLSERVSSLAREVGRRDKITIKLKGSEDDTSFTKAEVLERWDKSICLQIYESLVSALPATLAPAVAKRWTEAIEEFYKACVMYVMRLPHAVPPFVTGDYMDWLQLQRDLIFACDLAAVPFRTFSLPEELLGQPTLKRIKSNDQQGFLLLTINDAVKILPRDVVDGIAELHKWTENGSESDGLFCGLLFATRPFHFTELSLLTKDLYDEKNREKLQEIIFSLRGFSVSDTMPSQCDGNFYVPHDASVKSPKIALTSWKTTHESWRRAVDKKPDRSMNRYRRLCKLVNSLLSEELDCQYMVFPELSLPPGWFMQVAFKLRQRGISLIAGVEYLHEEGAPHVHNQVWASLLFDGFGFRTTVLYRQDKQRPAIHEECALHGMGNLTMVPELTLQPWPTIIHHGDFQFAMLICSELTNIDYRARLRGNIDTLFVVAWNQDIETFEALVESAALDIHAYIILCNDREFGDSRIRAPYRERWKRDVLRVKGGLSDYLVIGKLEVEALRAFQSNWRSPPGSYKPTPDGFEIAETRRRLPSRGAL